MCNRRLGGVDFKLLGEDGFFKARKKSLAASGGEEKKPTLFSMFLPKKYLKRGIFPENVVKKLLFFSICCRRRRIFFSSVKILPGWWWWLTIHKLQHLGGDCYAYQLPLPTYGPAPITLGPALRRLLFNPARLPHHHARIYCT